MKIRNNNKEVISRLSKRSLKNNRIRNIVALIAIILTTFMISTVFTVGLNWADNYKMTYLRYQGTTASITLNDPTDDQMTKIKELQGVDSAGYDILAGAVVSKELQEKETTVEMFYADPIDYEKQRKPAYTDIQGKYPEQENEIMVSKRALEKMGISEKKVGDHLTLNYSYKEKSVTNDFMISGIFTDYSAEEQVAANIFLSKAYVEKNNRTMDADGMAHITADKKKRSILTDILQDGKTVSLNAGQKFEFNYDITDQGDDANSVSVVVITIVCLFIILSGYLLIYNVLYISVIKDIHFYGLLKTIGTSPKQLKKIVKRQVQYLSYIGIPTGLVLSTLTSFVVVPKAMKELSFASEAGQEASQCIMTFHPAIYIGTILFSILTIVISSRKPAKVVSKLSPVEATRFTGVSAGKAKKNKNSRNSKIYKMAFRNVFRDKKRAAFVFFSLILGVTLYLCILSMLNSLKLENYVNTYFHHDYKIETNYAVSDDEYMKKDMVDKVASINGIDKVYVNYGVSCDVAYHEMFGNFIINQTKLNMKTEGLTEEDVNQYLRQIETGEVEYENTFCSVNDEKLNNIKKNLSQINLNAFQNGETILIGGNTEEQCSWLQDCVGKSITLTNKKTGIIKEFVIGGVISYDKIDIDGFGSINGMPNMYLSEKAILEFSLDPLVKSIEIDANSKSTLDVNAALKALTNGRDNISYTSKSDVMKQFSGAIGMMNFLTTFLTGLIILTGIINFINVMVTGVYARLKELAVLESIGMTKRQQLKMLTFEGLYYAVITTILILTVGVGCSYLSAKAMQNIADYAVFSYPMIQLITIILLIFIICLLVPLIVYRSTVKESITERMRTNES